MPSVECAVITLLWQLPLALHYHNWSYELVHTTHRQRGSTCFAGCYVCWIRSIRGSDRFSKKNCDSTRQWEEMDVAPFVSVSLLDGCVLKWDGQQPGVVTRSFVPCGTHAQPKEGLNVAATANVRRLHCQRVKTEYFNLCFDHKKEDECANIKWLTREAYNISMLRPYYFYTNVMPGIMDVVIRLDLGALTVQVRLTRSLVRPAC